MATAAASASSFSLVGSRDAGGLEEQYRLLFEKNPNPMWVFDRLSHAFLAVNDAAVDRYGYARAEFLDMTIEDLRPPADRAMLRDHFADPGERGRERQRWRHRRSDGTVVHVRITANDVVFAGRAARLVLCEDVTAEVEASAALLESENRYRDLFENAADPIATADLDDVITEVNAAFEKALGYSRDELIGTSLHAYLDESEREFSADARRRKLGGDAQVTTYEQEFFTKDGRVLPMEVSTRVITRNGEPVGIQGVCRDISERRRAAEALRDQARRDRLTGLPNRLAFLEEANRAILRAPAHGRVAMLVTDVNRFKEINDVLGHAEGDRLLEALAERMRDAVGRAGFVARLGSDDFGVLLDPVPDPEAAAEGAIARLRWALQKPFLVGGALPITVEPRIGMAVQQLDTVNGETLLQQADIARHHAKKTRQVQARYSPELRRSDPERLTLVPDLRRAMDQNELTIHYQPKVDLATGVIIGAEALLRWEHPKRGFIAPAEFIPLAEHTNLMTPLTLYVLEDALAKQRRWAQGGSALSIAVNLSARTLLDPEFPAEVDALLRASGNGPGRLVLEVTETAMITDPERSKAMLGQLRALGVELSVDDFGTGHSSLAYLSRLPLNELKIDRSFVAALHCDPKGEAIVRSIVNLGRDLGLETVAEGVETAADWRALAQLGCSAAQGFYISKALPSEELAGLLNTTGGVVQPPL